MSVGCIDADPASDCTALLDEDLLGNDVGTDAAELAYRGGRRYRREFLAVASDDRERDDLGRPRRAIRGDRSYLITGGLGDVGTHIAGWLADRGAGTIILVGRGAATETRERSLDQLRRKVDVRVYAADVADPQQVDRCFAQAAAELPPIAGIFHAAGVTRDAVIVNQTSEHLAETWRPKALGVRNLFDHARTLNVDGFVCISSIAGTFGAAGQANYAAANAYLESFVSWARLEDVPAQCLSYGPWDDTGMARALTASERARLERRGVEMLPALTAVHELERLWDSGDVQRVVFSGDAPAPVHVAPPASSAAPSAVRQLVASILRMPAGRIASDVPLTAMGLDSLMALELRTRCRDEYGADIPAVEFVRDLTVAQLVERIAVASAKDAPSEVARDLATEEMPLLPLSHGQRALWYLHQMQPASPGLQHRLRSTGPVGC